MRCEDDFALGHFDTRFAKDFCELAERSGTRIRPSIVAESAGSNSKVADSQIVLPNGFVVDTRFRRYVLESVVSFDEPAALQDREPQLRWPFPELVEVTFHAFVVGIRDSC